jgi:tetratricopeptide (TPR) repeat protein
MPNNQNSSGHRILIFILGVFLSLAPFVCKSAILYDFSNLPQSAYLQNISILFIIIFLMNALFEGKLTIKWNVFFLPIAGLLLWSFCSLFWSTNPSVGLAIWLNWFAGAIIFAVLYNLIRDIVDIKILIYCAILPLLFIVIVGLNQFLETELFRFYPQIVSPSVTFGNKNMMIDALIPLMPLALYLSIQNQFKANSIKIFGALLYGSGLTLVVLSDTRAGMVAVFIQMIVYIVSIFLPINSQTEYKTNKKNIFLIHGGAITLSAILFLAVQYIKNENINKSGVGTLVSSSQILSRVKSIFQTSDEDKWALQTGNKDIALKAIADSRTMRLVTWRNTLVMFLDKPIMGYGLFNWQIHYGEYRNAYLNDPVYRPGMTMVEVHNDYLQLLVDLGLPALFLAIWVAYFVASTLFMGLKKGDQEVYALCQVIGIGILGIYLVAVFSFPFERSVPVMLFFMYLAFLAFIRDKLLNQTKQKNILFQKKWLLAAILIFLVVLGGAMYVQNRRFEAEIEFKASYDQHATGNYSLAVQHAQRSLVLNPYRYTSYFLLGYSQLGLNQLEEAEKSLLIGLRYYPNDLNSLLQIGTTYTKLTIHAFQKYGKETPEVKALIQKSEQWFEKALSIRDDFHTIYFNKGVINWQRAVYANAHKDFEKAKEFKKKVVENYKKSIEFNPTYIDGLVTLAQFLFDNNEKKEAVSYAEKAVSILISDFENTEKELIRLENAKVLNTSRQFVDVVRNRKRSRQMLISSLNKALQILKSYYGAIEVDFEKYLEIVLQEEKYYLAKEVEIQEQFLFAEDALNRNKTLEVKNPPIYQALHQEFEFRKSEVNNFKAEKKMSNILLSFDKGQVYFGLKKYEESLQTFLYLLQISTQFLPEASEVFASNLKKYESISHLNVADIYCILSTVDKASQQLDLPKFLLYGNKIENHLKLVNLSIEDPLYKRFEAVSAKFLKYKEVVLNLKPKE